MRQQWKKLVYGVVGLALALPVTVYAQEGNDDRDQPRQEQREEERRDARPADADDAPDAPEDRDARDEREDRDVRDARDERDLDRPPVDEREPRSVRDERDMDDRDLPPLGSPSDMPAPIPMSEQRGQAHYGSQHVQNSCCCGSGNVVYSQGYAQAPRGYQSFSHQAGHAPAIAAPVYSDYGYGYNGGYISTGVDSYGRFNGANWNRFNEHDSRNFSGSYGSRASLRQR